jgi:hypothetical protein
LALCNSSRFPTQPVRLIFTIFLWHHISELSKYSWSISRSVQVSAQCKAVPLNARLCPSMKGRAPQCKAVPLNARLCPSVQGCAPQWKAVPLNGRLCPSMQDCAPQCKAVPLNAKLCPLYNVLLFFR